jgi:hypothetical protein
MVANGPERQIAPAGVERHFRVTAEMPAGMASAGNGAIDPERSTTTHDKRLKGLSRII